MITQSNPLPLIFFVIILLFANCNKEENSPDTGEHEGWHENMTGKILFGMDSLFVIDQVNTKHIPKSEDVNSIWEARWSPDGSKLLFISYNQGIIIMNSDGSGDTIVVNDDKCLSPVWSPDGSMIAYILNDSICVLNLENNNLTVFEQSNSKLEYIDWSPTGTKIVFTDNPGGSVVYIKILELIDASIVELIQHSKPVYYPSWSPEGNNIAFGSYDTDSYQIFTMNADGSNFKLIWNPNLKIHPIFSPWSPEGQLIAVGASDGVYIIDLNGKIITRIELFGSSNSLDWN